jgi:tRNA threonylcarbamoyl adenosine modification protein (Sua5/YciO/YrdC/YwlC family)
LKPEGDDMLIKLYNENPNVKQVREVAGILRDGGVIIYPTDTVYGLGCDIHNNSAIEKIAWLKGVRADKANFSFIVSDLSNLSNYTRFVNNDVFKLMKSLLPGPYTFILHASSNVPKILKTKKKTVGIRIPDNNIILDIVRELGNPILTTSIHDSDDIIDYTTDPELIHDNFKDRVDLVIDGGFGGNIPSTVIDCTGDIPTIIRKGAGMIEDISF